ncbi:MAG: hypothetical protein RL398_1532 [Planctomycetota bacterium]|jgi:hypothetical protein
MDHGNSGARAFEEFRLQRKRMQAKLGRNAAPGAYENDALRELEDFEAKEVRDQQMSREVQEFFSTATKQAAAIVEKVAREAQSEVSVRIQQEMEAFLRDAMERVSVLVDQLLHQQGSESLIAQAELEAKLGNLGRALDTFRWAGTANGADKHIGQDPFATDVDEVVREFRGQLPGPAATEPAADIEDHLVAQTAEASDAVADEPADGIALDITPTPEQELERFKAALKALVQQGTMTRDEARAAWQTRLASLGLAHA